MPDYEFQAEDGEVIARSFPMSRAPKLGKVIRVGGKTYRRVVSGAGKRSPGCIIPKYPYESFSIEPGWGGTAPGPNGGTMIPSRQVERDVIAQSKNRPGGRYARI